MRPRTLVRFDKAGCVLLCLASRVGVPLRRVTDDMNELCFPLRTNVLVAKRSPGIAPGLSMCGDYLRSATLAILIVHFFIFALVLLLSSLVLSGLARLPALLAKLAFIFALLVLLLVLHIVCHIVVLPLWCTLKYTRFEIRHLVAMFFNGVWRIRLRDEWQAAS